MAHAINWRFCIGCLWNLHRDCGLKLAVQRLSHNPALWHAVRSYCCSHRTAAVLRRFCNRNPLSVHFPIAGSGFRHSSAAEALAMKRVQPASIVFMLCCSMISAATAGDPFASPLGAMKIPSQPPQQSLLGLPAAPGFFAFLPGQRARTFRSQRPVIPQTTILPSQSLSTTGAGRRPASAITQTCPGGACPLVRSPGQAVSPVRLAPALQSDQRIHPQQQQPRRAPVAPLADPFRSPARQRPFDSDWMQQPVSAPRIQPPAPSALLSSIPYRRPLRTTQHYYQPEVPRYVETRIEEERNPASAAGHEQRNFVTAR